MREKSCMLMKYWPYESSFNAFISAFEAVFQMMDMVNHF